MDPLTALIAIAHLRLRLDTLRFFPHLICRPQSQEVLMAGEIREKMAALRAAKEKLVTDLASEIDGVMKDIVATKADGLEALKLPRAAVDAYKKEIQEIRDEFAPVTNGAPPGPLPGADASSAAPSGTSASAGAAADGQPQAGTDVKSAAAPSQTPSDAGAAAADGQPQAGWRGKA